MNENPRQHDEILYKAISEPGNILRDTSWKLKTIISTNTDDNRKKPHGWVKGGRGGNLAPGRKFF